jgi:pantoate--beta-alanine ligase
MKTPELLEGKAALRRWREALPAGKTLGFVPTMGALHEGHASLVRAAHAENEVTIASIYVNPLQFGPKEDLAAYPRTLERDLEIVGREGGDAVVTFRDADMYPPGFATHVEVEGLTEGLCGASRPGHFRGVATVVAKLFALVQPHRAYFGQKDAQQAAMIRRMTADLDLGIEIRVMPTVREPDGLAMSSRNAYLSPDERRRAVALSKALGAAQELLAKGQDDAKALRAAMRTTVKSVAGPDADIDYIEIVDPDTFRPVEHVERRAIAAVAVKIGRTRLIDNMFLDPGRP